MQVDLEDAFTYYAKDSDTINSQQFHNILHNFGFHKYAGTQDELKRHGLDGKEEFTRADCKNAVSFRMHKGGGLEEIAKDTYILFDKRDKGHIQARDI